VTKDSDVSVGWDKASGEDATGYSRDGNLMLCSRGWMGVTGSECWWYHAKTRRNQHL
jgi:hypothetical protein